ATPAATLVEQHDAVHVGIEIAPRARSTARSRAAVKKKRGLAVRVPATLPIHPVSVAHIDRAAVVGVDRRAERHTQRFSDQVSPSSTDVLWYALMHDAPAVSQVGHRRFEAVELF